MYEYVQSETPGFYEGVYVAGLWTTGLYKPDGKWEPESDHDSPQEAAARAEWLNGATENYEPDNFGVYQYVQSEKGGYYDGKYSPGLWTVGFYYSDGTWEPESDHNSPQEAADRVRWLNSDKFEIEVDKNTGELREAMDSLNAEPKPAGKQQDELSR